MTRPKPLPYEHLSDLAVSTATKLQCFRNLGKYFKQSAKALEKKKAREARFYGALIRLQQNWKIKRHRLVAAVSGNEGFYIDLFDNSLYDLASVFRPSSLCTIPVEHDAAGMLTVNLPRKSCHSLQFQFLGLNPAYDLRKSGETRMQAVSNDSSRVPGKEHATDEERMREMHLTIREVHRAIHDEQLYEDDECLCILDTYPLCHGAITMFNAKIGRRGKKQPNWEIIKAPLQPDSKQCGFLVMRYMREIIDELADNGSISLKSHFEHRRYSQEEIDEVRIEWANCVLEHI